LIINALYNYYETLLDDPDSEVSRPGFSKENVGHCLILSKDGQLLEIIDLKVESGKKMVPRKMNVPEQVKRTSGTDANYMCDNCMYVLGLASKSQKKDERIINCYKHFVQKHNEILEGLNDEGALALLKFLQKWNIAYAKENPVVAKYLDELSEGNNLVFKLEGSEGFLHQRKEILEAWDRHKSTKSSAVNMQCLVTGKISAIARLHPSIKGVTGAKSTGASIVSFEPLAFRSYGKEQSYNAPVSEEAAFGYTTALKYLISKEKHRVRIGDTTTVFWAERSNNGLEEDLLGALFFQLLPRK